MDDEGRGDAPRPWDRSPVPPEYQIRGLGPVLMSVLDGTRTELVLTKVLNMHQARVYAHGGIGSVRVYETGAGGAHAEVHVVEQRDLPPARPGAGGVHHVAFRTPDESEHQAWLERLRSAGIPNSGEVDRYYFRSLYFHEGNGLLFEIATDGPGFAVDEDSDSLGERVALPPFLEPRRAEILAGLKPID